MKYPLTDIAKNAAHNLLQAWLTGNVAQYFVISVSSEIGEGSGPTVFVHEGDLGDFECPPISTLWELMKFNMIDIRVEKLEYHSENWTVLLLQELRNAVESDFEVSEYFLTMNAVGTIIQGDLTLHPGAVMQSAAANVGNIQQTNEQLADELTMKLGQEFLRSQEELRQAIEQLRTSVEVNRPSKFGKIVLELGRCLEHGANTVGVINGITMVAKYLSQFPC